MMNNRAYFYQMIETKCDNNNNNNNNNNIFIFFRQGTRQLHRYLLTMFAVPLLLCKVNNVAIFVPISSRKRDTREAV